MGWLTAALFLMLRDAMKSVSPSKFDEGIDDRFPLFIIWKQLYLEGLEHNMASENF